MTQILAPSSLEFALQRLKTLLTPHPTIHPRSKLRGILDDLVKSTLAGFSKMVKIQKLTVRV